jgi:hypothetical protein
MIVCPNCQYENPDEALQCEACYTPLSQPPAVPTAVEPASPAPLPTTRLQQSSVRLLHVQTDTAIEIPPYLSLIHIGKPNETIPPDIDVSGYPDSDIVSRIHADLRVEAGIFYIEDTGSSNGTYINHTPLAPGNRHRLRAGDRISLGKGDKVTFIFQSS